MFRSLIPKFTQLNKKCRKYGYTVRKVRLWLGRFWRHSQSPTALNKSMQRCPSWEAKRCSASQEIPHILWNPKVHYRIHKSPPSSLSSVNQSSPRSLSTSWICILILSFHQRLGLPSGLLPSGLPTKLLYALLSPHTCYIPRPSHSSWFVSPE
jgi:hypothetical protein